MASCRLLLLLTLVHPQIHPYCASHIDRNRSTGQNADPSNRRFRRLVSSISYLAWNALSLTPFVYSSRAPGTQLDISTRYLRANRIPVPPLPLANVNIAASDLTDPTKANYKKRVPAYDMKGLFSALGPPQTSSPGGPPRTSSPSGPPRTSSSGGPPRTSFPGGASQTSSSSGSRPAPRRDPVIRNAFIFASDDSQRTHTAAKGRDPHISEYWTRIATARRSEASEPENTDILYA